MKINEKGSLFSINFKKQQEEKMIERYGKEFIDEINNSLPIKNFIKVDFSRKQRKNKISVKSKEYKKICNGFGNQHAKDVEHIPFNWRKDLKKGQKTWKNEKK